MKINDFYLSIITYIAQGNFCNWYYFKRSNDDITKLKVKNQKLYF